LAATPEAQIAERAGLEGRERSAPTRRVAISLKHFRSSRRRRGHAAGRAQAERARGTEATRGPDDVELAAVLGAGNLLAGAGDLAAAQPLYERALAIREARLGPDAPEVAASLSNLATLLRRQNHLPEARLQLERALAIQEKALRPDHPEPGATLNKLGNLCAAAGDMALAPPEPPAIQEQLPPDHPDLIRGLSNLGALLYVWETSTPHVRCWSSIDAAREQPRSRACRCSPASRISRTSSAVTAR
jgi:tetratricopeptide (TPR) repeat protein